MHFPKTNRKTYTALPFKIPKLEQFFWFGMGENNNLYIGKKALNEKQFVFLRDLANGYALVRASGGVVDLPSLVISAMELKV